MTFREQILNPSAIKLTEFIGAAIMRLTVNTTHPHGHYQTTTARSFEEGLPFINIRAVLVADDGMLVKYRDSLEMDIFTSKRRMVQVCLKANSDNKLIVRFAEAHPNGEVFYHEDRLIDASAVSAPGLLEVHTIAAAVPYYLASGNVIKP